MQQNNGSNSKADNTCLDEVSSPEFDFEEWKELNEKDPEAFEKKRKELIDNYISSAPKQYQRRLKGISFQVDAIRSRSKTPLQSCIEITKMMNDTVSDLRFFLKDLSYTISGQNIESVETAKKTTSADILSFMKK